MLYMTDQREYFAREISVIRVGVTVFDMNLRS